MEQATSTVIDLRELPSPGRLPVSRQGQLALLVRQLRWCDHAVRTAQRDTDAAMRAADLDEADRWAAVGRLRALVWKVTGEILPLVSRVPTALHDHPGFLEVLAAAAALRRTTESALRDNANHTVDLAAGWGRVAQPAR